MKIKTPLITLVTMTACASAAYAQTAQPPLLKNQDGTPNLLPSTQQMPDPGELGHQAVYDHPKKFWGEDPISEGGKQVTDSAGKSIRQFQDSTLQLYLEILKEEARDKQLKNQGTVQPKN